MTKQELIDGLCRMAATSDQDHEMAHTNADRLLLEFINDSDVTEAFDAIDKWYS